MARAGWKVPCRRRRASAAAVGACVVGVGGKEGRGRRGCAGRGRGSASRSPRFAARPWWRPGVRPTAAPAPPPPRRRRSAPPPSSCPPRPPGSLRASGAGSPPRGPPGRARGRVPGVCVPPAVTRGTPGRRPPSRARLRSAAAWCRAGAPSRASASGRVGRRRPLAAARRLLGLVPHLHGGGGRVAGGRWAGVCGGGARRPSRPRSVPLPPVVPGGAAGGAVGRGSLSLVFSPRRARLPTERPGAAGRRAGAAFRPPTRPPPPVRLPPSETRPQIRRGDPLNLSILVSGGKETNQDSLSNGE